MRARTFLSLGFATISLVACGGAGFADLGNPDDAGDAATADSTTIDSPTLDSGPGDAIDATVSDVALDAVIPCRALGGGATDVYVDSRFKASPATGPATGTEACPLPTILEGLTAADSLSGGSVLTVHVAGATPALVYKEVSSLTVNANVVLRGDGPAKTVVNAAGACGAGICAILIEGGGVLEGFTVASPGSSGGDGIVANHNTPAPIVKNVAAKGSKGSGVVALGPIELGPNIVANENGSQGVESPAGAKGLVHVHPGANSFDNNGANGLNFDGEATLQFEGGAASDNAFNGIRLAGAPTAGALADHTITGLNALRNKNTGISVLTAQNVTLRSSTLLGNTNLGLLYGYAANTVLDLGSTASAGANVFGGVTAAMRNGKAGIFLCRSRGPSTQDAEGDSWSACAPTKVSLTGCDNFPTSYVDVAYSPASASTTGDPLVTMTCALGP